MNIDQAAARIAELEAALSAAKDQFQHFQKLASEHRDELEAAREAAEAEAARLREALKQAEVWLSHMGYNIYGVLVKDDMPDHEPVLRAVRSALEAK